MTEEYIITDIDGNVDKYIVKTEEELIDIVESGMIASIIHINNGKIEYADVDSNNKIIWKEPESKESFY